MEWYWILRRVLTAPTRAMARLAARRLPHEHDRELLIVSATGGGAEEGQLFLDRTRAALAVMAAVPEVDRAFREAVREIIRVPAATTAAYNARVLAVLVADPAILVAAPVAYATWLAAAADAGRRRQAQSLADHLLRGLELSTPERDSVIEWLAQHAPRPPPRWS